MPSTEAGLPLRAARPTVRIDGRDVPALAAGLLEMRVHLPAHGMASAELMVGNWGSTGGGDAGFVFGDIRFGSRLQLRLGDDLVFEGEITALEERYGDGAPRLVLLAEDLLHRLARERASRSWEQISLDGILQELAGRIGLGADVAVDANPRDWLQHNESALAFALRLLAPLALPLRLQGGRLRARAEEPEGRPMALHAAGNASHVRLIADLNQQPREASARGFDLGSGDELQASRSALEPAPPGDTAQGLLQRLGWGGEAIRLHPAARDAQLAEAYAAGQMRARAERFIHGEIVCVDGLALAGGREVELAGVSPRLAGRYRIDDCWHRFDSSQGLTTRLRVRRASWPEGSA